MTLTRIQKYLSEIGFSSRREVERFIQDGWVAVNGSKITDPSIKIDPKVDKISFDKKVQQTKAQYSYYLFNKPKDVVTVNAQEGETEILDIVKVPKGVVTVGRLDKFSTGLIILTNDPVVARRLMDPDFYHEKEYLVEVTFPLNHRIIEQLKKPIEIYGQKTRPPIIVQKSSKKFLITLTEGKNRQIRKICEAVGLRISFLHRVRIVNLQIANLEAGQLKKLNQREVERLKKDLEIKEFEFEYF